MNKLNSDIPKTVDEAVDQIIKQMSLRERVLMAKIPLKEFTMLKQLYSSYVTYKLKDWSANSAALFEDCNAKSGNSDELEESQAAAIIIEVLWDRLRFTHKLRVI
jgi:hypothetical protein